MHLVCEGKVLSEADNWYVPSRLSEEMNHLLETTDIPFGKVVRGLAPYRKTFDVDMKMQDALFEHKAILYSSDGKPFSEVHERYQPQLLDYPLSSGGLDAPFDSTKNPEEAQPANSINS